MKQRTMLLVMTAALAAGVLSPGTPAAASPVTDQAPDQTFGPPGGVPEGPSPQIPAPPQPPTIPGVDQQRALREVALAKVRLAEAAAYARAIEDGPVLLAIARKALDSAQQLYDAGRYYQAAETAAAAVRLTEAIRHLYWAQAR